ncbi:hypothetical protein LTR27_012221 [Elasticomyces elasticus]|nr:hypothetical protein LTR27_012221 [Elasticomyces elasticus]
MHFATNASAVPLAITPDMLAINMSRLDQIYQHNLSSIDQCQQHLGPGVKPSECIRLLRVIDGNTDEAHANSIFVELQTTTRSTCPSYVAASYAWSLDPPTGTIRFTHCLQTMSVTNDLLAAIAALSRIYPDAWFWLDAVSIDQANLAEKSVQVAGMGETYKQAVKTAVWLGQEFAEDTASSDHPPGVQGPASVYGLTVASLENLARRSDRVWWRRTWIVQEMVLAQDLEVVVGARAISWADFVSAVLNAYNMAREDMIVLDANDAAGTDAYSNRPMAQGITNIFGLKTLRVGFRARPNSQTLNILLMLTSDTHCNDPRDKIYALLGLATDFDRSNIKVDYTLGTAQVFTSVARYLTVLPGLNILQHGWVRRAGLPYDPMDETSLPSWVPDYSFEMGLGYTQGPQIHYHNNEYSKGGSSKGRMIHMRCSPSDVPAIQWSVYDKPSIVADDYVKPHELHMEGLMFDQIEEIFYAREEDRDSLPHGKVMGLDELSRHIPPTLDRDLPATEPRHHIDRSAAFWNTVLLHRPTEGYIDYSESPRPLAVTELLASPPSVPVRPTDGAKEPASHTAEIYREFELTMQGAALFTTALGFFALGPTFMRPGDCVAVLFGGKTPFVLRPTGKPGECTFVGHCYVHGIMNGELIKLLDRGLLEPEWFVLV